MWLLRVKCHVVLQFLLCRQWFEFIFYWKLRIWMQIYRRILKDKKDACKYLLNVLRKFATSKFPIYRKDCWKTLP